jgi:hypothetical protein
MSIRTAIRRNGDYPAIRQNDIVIQKTIRIGNTQSFLLVTYQTLKTINIYIGGPNKWCIYCELIKNDNTIKPIGYLTKVRYDLQCSLEHSFVKGKDTKELVRFLIQYIHNNYPMVKDLLYNDLSTRTCDNGIDVNLAVMTYLYSEQTWYEKNFGSRVAPDYENEWNRIKRVYQAYKEEVDWETMRETIRNDETITGMSDIELEELYNHSKSWKDFFGTIHDKIKIDTFCIFLSGWIDSFIRKYFNTLQGLTYLMPIKDYNINYIENDYKKGGRRYTRKATRKQSKDYK